MSRSIKEIMFESHITNAERALLMIRGMEEQRLIAERISSRAEVLLARHRRAVELCDGLNGCESCARGYCESDVKIIARLEEAGVLRPLDKFDFSFNEDQEYVTDYSEQLYSTPGFYHLQY